MFKINVLKEYIYYTSCFILNNKKKKITVTKIKLEYIYTTYNRLWSILFQKTLIDSVLNLHNGNMDQRVPSAIDISDWVPWSFLTCGPSEMNFPE